MQSSKAANIEDQIHCNFYVGCSNGLTDTYNLRTLLPNKLLCENAHEDDDLTRCTALSPVAHAN